MNPHGDYTYKDDDEKIRCKVILYSLGKYKITLFS